MSNPIEATKAVGYGSVNWYGDDKQNYNTDVQSGERNAVSKGLSMWTGDWQVPYVDRGTSAWTVASMTASVRN